MHLLAFAASNSRHSINHTLLKYASDRLKAKISDSLTIELLDLNDFEIPIFSIDRENENGIPAAAQEFYKKIGNADALLVSFAEHNGYVTAVWKNLFDWMSRIETKVWQQKPIVVLSASPGGRAGANVLASQEVQIPRFGGDIKGMLGIGKWDDAWDSDTETLKNVQDIEALDQALAALQ